MPWTPGRERAALFACLRGEVLAVVPGARDNPAANGVPICSGTEPQLPVHLIIDDDPESAVPATFPAIRAAFHPQELYYGTIVDLRADDGELLSAAAATGPFARPADEAECYLCCEVAGRRLYRRGPLSRAATVALFERFLAGDREFVREPGWIEGRAGD